MNDNPDVYDLLKTELANELMLHIDTACTIVDYLEEHGFLDYDTLKEIYLIGVNDD